MSKKIKPFFQLNIYNKIRRFFYLGASSYKNWRGEHLEAITKLNQVISLDPKNPDIHWRLGSLYLKLFDIDRAIRHLQKAVELGERKPKYLLWLSTALNTAGNTQSANSLVQEVLENNPRSSEAWCIKGKALVIQGFLKEGLKCFEKAIELDPQNSTPWNEKGCLHLVNNETLLALEAFQKGLKINPKDISLLFNIGLAYLKLEKYSNSVIYLEKAKNHKLECIELFHALGLCYSKINKLELAEENYQKALDFFQSHNIETICNLAAVKGKKGLYEEALKLYEQAIKQNPYDALLHNNAAWCLEKMNNIEEAIKFYYLGLALEPSNIIFRLNLSECLFKKGYLPEAIEHLEVILSNDPTNHNAWRILGNIYDTMKLYAKAVDCFNKALGLE